MTQAKLGSMIGIYGSEVSKIERGIRVPGEDLMVRIETALSVTFLDPEPEADEFPGPQSPWAAGHPDERTPTPAAATEPSGSTTRRRGLRDRLRRKSKAEAPPGTPRPGRPEKAPRPARGRRVSAANDISDVFGWSGGFFARVGHVPVGRMRQLEAPIAGELLDQAVKDTLIDRVVIQRAVKTREKWDLAAGVL